jgi:SAM-dependent MidA family methyltransferase
MTQGARLPPLSATESAHASRVHAVLVERIWAGGGWISFSDFMRFALYAPGLGYYSAGARKFGPQGDFITAPELTPLFAACVARQAGEIFERCGGRTVLEFGAGSGALAVDLVRYLAADGIEIERYSIVEVSADLRNRQQERVRRELGERSVRFEWLDRLPEQPMHGIMIANEVLDALPVERFRKAGERIDELGVALIDGELAIAGRPAPAALAAAVNSLPIDGPEHYESEICMQLPAWVAAATHALASGVLLVMDYGLPRRQYYHPERRQGSLLCHYRHRAHADALVHVGLQDITAWVDFTALAEAGSAAGLDVLGFTTQAQFLMGADLETRLAAHLELAGTDRAATTRALNRLLLPGDMGEAFKVMALGRGIAEPLLGFRLRDLRHTL